MLESGATLSAIVIFVSFGLIAGFIYDIFRPFKKFARNTIYINIILDFLFCLVAGTIFILLIFNYEFGDFALFELILFAIGIIFQQIFVSKMFAKAIKFVYNKLKSRKKINKMN